MNEDNKSLKLMVQDKIIANQETFDIIMKFVGK